MRLSVKLFALIVISCWMSAFLAHAAGKPTCAPRGDEADWRVYADSRHHFCFLYPKNYELAKGDKDMRGAQTLHSPDLDILIGLNDENFDLQALVRQAPTGVEFPPEPYVVGQNKFYYYGPGGGGVSYPDQFFYDLRGKTLSIDFDGGYAEGRTPSAETKRLERRILATFRTY